MSARNVAANLLLDVALSAVGLALIFWGVTYIRNLLEYQRWLATQNVAVDPADTEIWDVLKEARRITEEAAAEAAED